MHLKTKVALMLSAIGLSMTVQASEYGAISSYIDHKTDSGFKKIADTAYASDKGRESFYAGIREYIEKNTDSDSVAKANELSINVTSMIFPQFAGYWDNVATWNNVPVYQNHDLYDMDRYSLPKKYELSKNLINQPDIYLVDGSRSLIQTSPFGKTESLMSQGLPGVGPDGAAIKLCRLYKSTYAPYVEIADYDAKALMPLIGSGTVSALCLPESLTRDYWIGRKSDFFNNFGDSIKPPKNLQSY